MVEGIQNGRFGLHVPDGTEETVAERCAGLAGWVEDGVACEGGGEDSGVDRVVWVG